MFNFENDKLIWIKALTMLLIQAIIVCLSFFIYVIVSWLFLGEGAGSAFYSSEELVGGIVIPLIGPSIFNFVKIIKAYNVNTKKTLVVYSVIESALLIGYTLLWVLYYS